MKKFILRGLVVLLVLVILAGVAITIWIDSIAREAVERAGTYVLGVETTAGKVDVGLRQGNVSLADLRVANPDGFDTPHFMNLTTGTVDSTWETLSEKPARVAALTLDGIDVNLEGKAGKRNYEVIIENLKRFESDEPKPESEGQAVTIDELAVRNISVHTNLAPLVGDIVELDVEIPEIVLENVGSADNPMTMDQVIAVVVEAILTAVVKAGVDLPAELLEGLTKGLGDLSALEDVGAITADITGEGLKVIGEIGEGLGRSVEDIGKEAGKAIEGVGKEAEGILKGVGGLLGGEKKNK